MINRRSIACKSCEKEYTLRVAFGRNQYQEHTLACVECGTEIKIGLELDFKIGGATYLFLENCRPSEQEGLIYNLHPDFLIPKEKLHRDRWSSNLEGMSELFKASPDFTNRMMEEAIRPGSRIELKPIRDLVTDWKLVRRLWSMHLNGKVDAAKRLVAKDGPAVRISGDADPTDVLIAFCMKGGRLQASKCTAALLKARHSAMTANGRQVEELDLYIIRNHNRGLIRALYTLVGAYMDGYSEFSQTLEYQDAGIDINSGYVLSSHAINKTRLFYGEAFEFLGSFFVVPALLNNVIAGRNHDQFASLPSVSAYLQLDKSSRYNCFADHPDLEVLSEAMNNRIRNGSHHGTMHLDADTNEVCYTPKKDGPEERMSYISYLALCNTTAQTAMSAGAYLLQTYPTI